MSLIAKCDRCGKEAPAEQTCNGGDYYYPTTWGYAGQYKHWCPDCMKFYNSLKDDYDRRFQAELGRKI